MTEALSFVGASIAWFTPLAAIRVYENAFALSYTGVNLACMTMTLMFVPLIAFTYMLIPYPRTIGILASIANVVGLSAFLASPFFFKSLDPESQTLFWVASGLVGFNFADNLVKALVSATGKTSIKAVEGATLAANRAPSLSLLGLPVGMLFALILTEMLYDVKDTYFTNEVEAMSICSDKSMILILVAIVTDFGSLACGGTPWTSNTEESPIASKSTLKDWCLQALRPRTFVISFELTLTLVGFFFALLQPEYLTNTFRFTSQDAKILLTYLVMGYAIGCIICPGMIESLGSTVRV